MVLEYRIQFIILVMAVISRGQVRASEASTWQLEKGRDWKPVATKDEDKYLLVVARTEKLVETGQTMDLYQEWSKLRYEFPEITEQDLDTFIEAELFFCDRKFTKAVASYDKFLEKDYRQSRLYDAALDRQFHIGEAFLAGWKKTVLGIFKIEGAASGVKIMEKITDRAEDQPIAMQAAVAVAESYEKREMFNEGHLKWSEISWQWKTGQIARQALLGMARCKHAAYKGPRYDASCLQSARSYYEDFKLRYPEDAEELGIDGILAQIDEELAYKQLSIGQYYQRIGNRLSANLYYDMVIRNWPESQPAELARQMLNKDLLSTSKK